MTQFTRRPKGNISPHILTALLSTLVFFSSCSGAMNPEPFIDADILRMAAIADKSTTLTILERRSSGWFVRADGEGPVSVYPGPIFLFDMGREYAYREEDIRTTVTASLIQVTTPAGSYWLSLTDTQWLRWWFAEGQGTRLTIDLGGS